MHRVRAEHQPLGDLGVAEARCDEAEDLDLARGQVALRRGSREVGRSCEFDLGSLDAGEFERGPRDGGRVPVPREMIGALEGDERGPGDPGGDLATQLERDRPVVASVQDRGRGADLTRGVLDVVAVDRLE